ncbi:SHOCT domain-containing protein [Arthrobacter sp. CG_A4]|uniref:SHOCT domain-containing protein n=1 Tax=Arthrobacter sp. CG_A4 TaxID=3071706 RepID=UPI002E125923
MVLMMLVFWGGVVTVVVLLLRRTPPREGPGPARPPHYDAELILHERFARGEIDETEYAARRSALRHLE